MLTRKLPGNPVLLPKVTYKITITHEIIATIKHKILEKNAKIKPIIVDVKNNDKASFVEINPFGIGRLGSLIESISLS